MQHIAPFNAQHLTAIAKSLGDTSDGLTGSEIAALLVASKIRDTDPGATKWRRLYNALAAFQNERQFGNHVVVFINAAMDPVRFTAEPQKFRRWRDRVNPILSFSGLSVSESGKVIWVKPASSQIGRAHV